MAAVRHGLDTLLMRDHDPSRAVCAHLLLPFVGSRTGATLSCVTRRKPIALVTMMVSMDKI